MAPARSPREALSAAAALEEDSDSGSALEVRVVGARDWRRNALRGAGALAVLGLLVLALASSRMHGGAAAAGAAGRAGAVGHGSGAAALRGVVGLQGDGDGCKDSNAWCTRREVALYCFSQIVAGGAEEDLVRLQLKHRISIFACDDFSVTCADDRLLGTDREGREVRTIINPESGKAAKGDLSSGATTSSFLNVLIFMKAWDILLETGKVWKNDWTVKADPDAVFFPSRLRSHLKAHTGGSNPPSYLLNCKEKHWKQTDSKGDGNFFFVPKLYGALEVYNKKALGAYKDAHKMCLDKLPWQKWGEDLYMRMCMDMLGAAKVVDYLLVGDHRCPANPPSTCAEANRPAYHPHKNVGDWFTCWNQSMGLPVGSSSLAWPATSDTEAKPYGTCGGAGKTSRPCPKGFHCHHASKWYWQCLKQSDTETAI